MVDTRAPLHIDVGICGGAEAAVHATRRYTNCMPDSHVFVKLDFANTFNTLRRDCLLEAMSQDAPELYQFSYAAYSATTILQYGHVKEHSKVISWVR